MKKKITTTKVMLIIILVLSIILGIMTAKKVHDKKVYKEREREFVNAATKFYEDHMSNILGLTSAEVTLKNITNADEEYEISSLETCDKEKTKIVFTLEEKEIIDKEYEIVCK